MESHKPLCILFTYNTDPAGFPPAKLNPLQILCGPHCQDKMDNGRVVSFRTPFGEYDIGDVLRQIPHQQAPDLLIVKSDPTQSNYPRNVSKLAIPKVLILGDTQHLRAPLRGLLSYALSERYDAYVTDHKRHHLHYFIEAGLPNVYWIPGMLLNNYGIPFQHQGIIPLSFVGQSGKFHPCRKRMIEYLQAAGKPLKAGGAAQDEASMVYARSLLTLNQSLNGDFKLRVFEALFAGGCLLTDHLAPQSGVDLLFKGSEHLIQFDDFSDFADKIDYFLAHPNEALAIAKADARELGGGCGRLSGAEPANVIGGFGVPFFGRDGPGGLHT